MKDFERRYMGRPYPSPCSLYDYQICDDEVQLSQIIDEINHLQFKIISVTQDPAGRYTVVFLR